MLSFSNKNRNLLTYIFFSLFLLLGIFSFSDYGISIDEDNTRLNGFVSLKYILEIFNPRSIDALNKIIDVPNINEFSEKGIGVIYDLPLAFLEFIFQINDSRNYYLLRHFFNFLFYFVGVCFFYLLVKRRFNSWLMGLVGALFLIVTPRLFAESFYNNKDLVFLSLFIICLYTSITFLENPTYKNVVVFSITSSLAIDIRIIGIIIPILIFFFYFVNSLEKKETKYTALKISTLFIFSSIFFIVLFWPYLWDDPFTKFFQIFKSLSNYNTRIYNFYLGDYVSAKTLPWHYSVVWQVVTIPILYIFLFLFGFFKIIRKLFKRFNSIETNESFKDIWKTKEELQDLVFLSTYFVPLFAVISFNSTLYDGWRHLYFIYPSFLMISLYGLNFLRIKYFIKFKNTFFSLLFVLLVPTIIWMVKYHPHQYVYFNKFAENNFEKLFEMDYWGVSNYEALNYIALNNNEKVSISKAGTTDLKLSKSFLKKNLRENILITSDLNNSDFIVINYRDWAGKTKDFKTLIPKNYKIYYQIKIDDRSINTVYKKNN